MAGALLVTLSVSAAFGAAPPSGERNRGQSIASFVHELIFDTDESEEDQDEEVIEEEPVEEELSEEELSEADEELEEEVDEEVDEESDSHGECVSEVARDKDAIGGPNENHGGAVSEAARETCWETDDTDEDTVEEEDEVIEEEDEELSEDEDQDEESESHGACVSAAAQDKDGSVESELKNHGKWVSQHARYTCWGLDVPDEDEETGEEAGDVDEESSDVDEVAEDADADAVGGRGNKPDKADRGNGKPSWAGQGGNGNGNGNGGNGRAGGRR